MHTGELPKFVGKSWLSDLIVHAVNVGACVSWGCTTCGTMPFRRSLVESASAAVGDHPTDHEVSLEIARRLRDVPGRPELVEVIRFVIMFLYARSGSQLFEQDLLPLFAGTAEHEYRAMAVHHAHIMERRRADELRNAPEEIARRKVLKEVEKQERLAKRAVRKAEIDRTWRERRAPESQSEDR